VGEKKGIITGKDRNSGGKTGTNSEASTRKISMGEKIKAGIQ